MKPNVRPIRAIFVMTAFSVLIFMALSACTSQPVTTIGVGGVWNTQDHQAVGGHGGNGSGGGRGGRGAASGGMGRG